MSLKPESAREAPLVQPRIGKTVRVTMDVSKIEDRNVLRVATDEEIAVSAKYCRPYLFTDEYCATIDRMRRAQLIDQAVLNLYRSFIKQWPGGKIGYRSNWGYCVFNGDEHSPINLEKVRAEFRRIASAA